jgi:hypothetical protein
MRTEIINELCFKKVVYAFGSNVCGQSGINEKQYHKSPIKINDLFEFKIESIQTKSFRENKFIDIATHSHYDISIALSVNQIYFIWGKSECKPEECDFRSLGEIFAVKFGETAKAIRIPNNDNYIPNNKYLNKFVEILISEIESGSYGQVFKVKHKSSSELFTIKISIKDENESLKELCTSLLISELNSNLIVRFHDVWYENDLVIENGFRKWTDSSTL